MKMINDEQRSKVFYSNCLIEAIKAKLKNKNAQIIFVPKKFNDSIGFHCFWKIDDLIYDFKCESNVKHYWQMILFKGYIRANSFENYRSLMYGKLDMYLEKTSKDYGKKFAIVDPYTASEAMDDFIPIETTWHKADNIPAELEGEEVQVFYKDKGGKKHIKYATVHDGKVDIGKYQPLSVKWADFNDPTKSELAKYNNEDKEEETQENEQ